MKKILLILLLSTLGAFAQSSTMLLLYGYEYEYETQVYLSSLTTPLSYDQQVRLNTFVKMLKDSLQISALSSKFDVMYLLANETSEAGLKNLVKRSHDATAVNSPTFTQWEGFAGNGTSSYLNTNYSDSVNSVTFQLNNCSSGIYSRTNSAINATDYGAYDVPTSIHSLAFKLIDNRVYPLLNSASNSYIDTAATSLGFGIMSRTSSANYIYYKNGLPISTREYPSIRRIVQNIYICCRNNNGTVAEFTTRQYSFWFAGAGLTATEVSKLTNCIEWYMDSVNRGVIP